MNAFSAGYNGLYPYGLNAAYGYSPLSYGLPAQTAAAAQPAVVVAPKVEVEEKPVELVTYANGAVVPEEPLANKLAKAAHFDVKAATYANFARYAPYQHAAAATYGYNRLFKREAEAEPQYLASPYSYSPYNSQE